MQSMKKFQQQMRAWKCIFRLVLQQSSEAVEKYFEGGKNE